MAQKVAGRIVVLGATIAFLSQCGSSTTEGPSAKRGPTCRTDEVLCVDGVGHRLRCQADGAGWVMEPCDEGTMCYEGSCQALTCVPGSTECRGNIVVTCAADGQSWGPGEPCGDRRCDDGSCRDVLCQPGEFRCNEQGGVERCRVAGTAWDLFDTCEGLGCVDGYCLPAACEEGDGLCGRNGLFRCVDGAWQWEGCPLLQPCLFGACVECVTAEQCDSSEQCVDGVCLIPPLMAVAPELTPAEEGQPYEAEFQATGGVPPYRWAVVEGVLPRGLSLSRRGYLSGIPWTAGTWPFTAEVTDDQGETSSVSVELFVWSLGGQVEITTTALPEASHGYEYARQLEAVGGAEPYAWQVLEGLLPAGMTLSSDGLLSGVPSEIGSFPLMFRVIDGATPPTYDSRELPLVVEVSPLEITGDREYNLLVTKIIILGILVPYIPYSGNLEARGGLTPYQWEENDLPRALRLLVGSGGLPDGLTLDSDGRLAGWVTDVSDAVTVNLPFGGPELAGYFFSAEVTDSQSPADSDEAIFCIPTVSF